MNLVKAGALAMVLLLAACTTAAPVPNPALQAADTATRAAEQRNQNEERSLIKEGFTDNVGRDQYNTGLSKRRVDAVKLPVGPARVGWIRLWR